MTHVGTRQPSLICFWTSVHLLFSYKIARYWASRLSKAYFSKLIAQYYWILAHKIQIFDQFDTLYGLYNELWQKTFEGEIFHVASHSCFAKSTIKRNIIEYENYINRNTPSLGSHFQWEKTFGRGRRGHSEVNLLTDKSQFILSKREKLKMKFYLLGVSLAFVVQSDCP